MVKLVDTQDLSWVLWKWCSGLRYGKTSAIFYQWIKKNWLKIVFLIGKDDPSHLSCTISMVTGKIIYWITWWYFAQIATAKPTHLEQRIRKFECPIGNFRSRTLQIRGSLTSMKLVIPSQVTPWVKGVETRRRAPAFRNEKGEGIVQTTNPGSRERRKPKR